MVRLIYRLLCWGGFRYRFLSVIKLNPVAKACCLDTCTGLPGIPDVLACERGNRQIGNSGTSHELLLRLFVLQYASSLDEPGRRLTIRVCGPLLCACADASVASEQHEYRGSGHWLQLSDARREGETPDLVLKLSLSTVVRSGCFSKDTGEIVCIHP